jgi:hypothetical protein
MQWINRTSIGGDQGRGILSQAFPNFFLLDDAPLDIVYPNALEIINGVAIGMLLVIVGDSMLPSVLQRKGLGFRLIVGDLLSDGQTPLFIKPDKHLDGGRSVR